MIIELFGPPSSGKTTLCHALAEHLRERGLQATLDLSSRPVEIANKSASDTSPIANAVRRIAGPASQLLTTGSAMFGNSPEAMLASDLLELLPPRNGLWSLRLRRYIWRRAHGWNQAQRSGRIVVFDQAFVQVIFSLAALSKFSQESRLEKALDRVPMADLHVRLEAPVETLKARLVERWQSQGRVERWLEVDPQTNLQSLSIFDVMQDLLRRRGKTVLSVQSIDQSALSAALRRLEQAMTEANGEAGEAA